MGRHESAVLGSRPSFTSEVASVASVLNQSSLKLFGKQTLCHEMSVLAPQVSITSSLHLFYCFNTGNLTDLGISTSHSRPMGTTLKRTTTTFRSLSTLLKPHNNITRLALVYGEAEDQGRLGNCLASQSVSGLAGVCLGKAGL